MKTFTKIFISTILLATVAAFWAIAFGAGYMSDEARIGAGVCAAAVLLIGGGVVGRWLV